MVRAGFGIETLYCRVLLPVASAKSIGRASLTTSGSATFGAYSMLKLRAAAFAGSFSGRRRTVLRISGRRWRIKFLALSGLLLMNSPAVASIDTLKMTCAQVQSYIKAHGQTLVTTGAESGNYSFSYADCGGTVPGYACTTDEVYCHIGWWCDYNYPAQVNPETHDQGVNFCPARRH
jgi:hypothetical protein